MHRNKSNEDNLRCWKALRYTKEWATSVTPALKSQDGSIAVTIEEKENLVRIASFPTPPSDDQEPLESIPGEAYNEVSKELVYRAIHLQSGKKAPGPDRINFRAIRLLWIRDAERIIALIRQFIRQGHCNSLKLCASALIFTQHCYGWVRLGVY